MARGGTVVCGMVSGQGFGRLNGPRWYSGVWNGQWAGIWKEIRTAHSNMPHTQYFIKTSKMPLLTYNKTDHKTHFISSANCLVPKHVAVGT